MISQLFTTGGSTPLLDANGQVVHWNAALYEAGTDTAYNALIDSLPVNGGRGGVGLIEGATVIADYGILAGGQHDPQDAARVAAAVDRYLADGGCHVLINDADHTECRGD